MPALRSAFYDLQVSPYSYDFLNFICMARAEGCNHTVFVPGERAYQKCTPEQQAYRLENLLVPLARMAGEVTVCKTRDEALEFYPDFPKDYTVKNPVHAHTLGQLIGSQKARWLSPSKAALAKVPQGKTTITIRESSIKPGRNSRLKEWQKAAREIQERGHDVLFVPDTDNQGRDFGFPSYPVVDPDERMALYQCSTLNLGIGNGPMGLCMYQTYPYLVFRFHDELYQEQSAAFLKANKLPVGSQLPWRKGNQAIVWEQDYADVIVKHVERWEMRKAA